MNMEKLSPERQKILDLRSWAIERELLEFEQRERDRRQHAMPQMDLARTVLAMSNGGVNGEDREYLQEVARQHGRQFDCMRPFISFRDLNKASGPQGGYLTSTESRDPVDVLRPFSVTQRMGMQIELGLVGDVAIPKVSATTTPQWLSNETTQVTPSQPTLVQVAMSPKQVGDVVVFSRQLAKQVNADRFVGQELLRTIGSAIDVAVIGGSGAAGQPTGILNTAGVQTQSGTTLNSGVNTMKRKSAEAKVNDEQITFLSTPAVRELLEGREKATGGGNFVWQKDQVADRPAFVSTDMPVGTMLCGDWSLVVFGVWGQGFVLEVNPYDPTGFRAGLIQGRVIVSCDIGVTQAAAFISASSIT